MSFNLDDPLAGILSDGSDDSFFDDDILGKKKPTNKKSKPIAEKKSALFDLHDTNSLIKPSEQKVTEKRENSAFSSKLVTKTDDNKSNDPLDFIDQKTNIPVPNKNQSKDNKNKPILTKTEQLKSPFKSKLSSTSNEKLNILDDLVGPKKEILQKSEKGKSSQSLLDDILGEPINGTIVTKTNLVKNQDHTFDSILGKSEYKQAAPLSKKQTKSENAKDLVQQKKTKPSEDWLGIFQNKDENFEEEADEMPSWLVGEGSKKKSTFENSRNLETIKEAQKDVSISDSPPNCVKKDEVPIETEKESQAVPNIEKIMTTVTCASKLQDDNEDITMQSTALYLQQQEAQLMVALQLKAQDEKLASMQLKQKEVQRVQREAAMAEHAQLDGMLQRQAAHRQQMQAVIAAHQERITQRIKALLGSDDLELNNDNNPENIVNVPNENKESPSFREKKQLLQLVQSLQENHDKEIDLMETSYRRQLAFLEVSVDQTDERMKAESEKLVKFYTEKIKWLEEHHQLYRRWSEENMNALTQKHKTEKEMLQQQHLEDIKALQDHHASLVENIKNAVKQEQFLIQDSVGFSTDIRELLMGVKANESKSQQLIERVQELTEKTQQDTEKSLRARETQIDDMIQQLKKERESFEKEKVESKEIIKMLEARLKQMTAMIEEESTSLKQKKMEFEFEKATFRKQTEFAKNVLRKQNEEVKMLKEDMLKEYREKKAIIDEENAKALRGTAIVAKEKSSIQSLKLELEKTKVELQAQLQEMTTERIKINQVKQELHMEEQRILAKGKEVELLVKTSMAKQAQAEKKYAEAESLQGKYEEGIRRLQEHVVSLNVREKQIAREKVALSRERLSLHNDLKKIENMEYSLCRTVPKVQPVNLKPSYTDNTYNVPVSRELDSDVSHAMNDIEFQMAQIMGRTFSLKHDSLARHRDVDGKSPSVGGEDGNIEATPSQHFQDYSDPKFMMLRSDIQRVLSNIK